MWPSVRVDDYYIGIIIISLVTGIASRARGQRNEETAPIEEGKKRKFIGDANENP